MSTASSSASVAPQNNALLKYDEACAAVAACRTIYEAKDVVDKMDGLRVFAHAAKNRQLEVDATEIRINAERKLGELLSATELHSGGRPRSGPAPLSASGLHEGRGADDHQTGASDAPVFDSSAAGERLAAERPTLADLGIDKKLSARAQKLAAVPQSEFDTMLGDWRTRVAHENERVTANLLKAGGRAGRRENDFYPTPQSIIDVLVKRWRPKASAIWEPCEGDGRVAESFRAVGHAVVSGDLSKGQDFFAFETPPLTGGKTGLPLALGTNPPFGRVREFIDHAFAIGISEMALVLPERLWACGEGRKQFERHRPAVWANMDWREDYLGAGGSADRALAVALWDSPCAERCDFEVWSREMAA